MASNQIQRVTFKMGDVGYETDLATLEVLRSIVPAAELSSDATAVEAIMGFGLRTGRIVVLP